MATGSKVQLSLDACGVFHVPGITKESAAKASELLQENHDRHHIFFNADGFHNHIAHHQLTLYALGANPDQLQRHFDEHKGSQRAMGLVDTNVLEELRDPDKFCEYLGDEKHYRTYLTFFEQEIDKDGYPAVVNKYLFGGDKPAEAILVRMFAGLLHPLIHLGFGIEFQQPAIIAEAFAQTAVHSGWIGDFLLPAEKAAALCDESTKNKSLVDLLTEICNDEKLSTAAHWSDGNKIRDGLLARAPDEMIHYASQFTVSPSQLEEKTAEMINALIWYTAGAQHPPKQVKFDFYYMHCVNCSLFFGAFVRQEWMSRENKARLVEWQARMGLAMFASRRSPEPLMKEITNYKPARPDQSTWPDIYDRILNQSDDGHGSKLLRALSHGEQVTKGHTDEARFPIQGDMWLQLGNMVIDSVQDKGSTWVRSAGFDEAWDEFENRPESRL